MFDLQTIACKVYSILTDLPESRDDDRILLANIWLNENKAKITRTIYRIKRREVGNSP